MIQRQATPEEAFCYFRDNAEARQTFPTPRTISAIQAGNAADQAMVMNCPADLAILYCFQPEGAGHVANHLSMRLFRVIMVALAPAALALAAPTGGQIHIDHDPMGIACTLVAPAASILAPLTDAA